MKNSAGGPLHVSLRWAADDVQPVGRLAYRGRIAYLEYDEAFLATGLELSPVHHGIAPGAGPGMVQPHDKAVFDGLHGVFNDSLPDGWGRLLVDRRARQLGIGPATLTPLDRLAWVGARGIGALCYEPALDVWNGAGQSLDLDQLASDARLVLDGDVDRVLAELGRAGGSPAGARPKALVALDGAGHAIHGSDSAPAGFDNYLVKFPSSDDPEDAAQIEQAYAEMARRAGIAAPETALLPGREGQFYFASRRFDRNGGRRVHVHSASGLLYADIRLPSLDYQDLVFLTRAVTRDRRACKAMAALAAFNVLAHNRDDHARQFSYIMERNGVWRLAPAYDLTFAEGPGGEHATSVMGRGKAITRDHLLQLGRKADLDDGETAGIIEAVETAVADWRQFARECGVTTASTRRVARVLDSIRL